MKRAGIWLWEHWWLIALAVALGCLVLWSRSMSPREAMARLRLELSAIRAKGEARAAQEELGAERARERIEETYRNEVVRLTAEQQAKAKELTDDPVALAEFLVRAGGSGGAQPMGGNGT